MSACVVLPEARVGTRARLGEEDGHHLRRVRRAQVGDPVEVVDGRGGAYRARIVRLDPVEIEVLERVTGIAPVPVTVALAIVRPARMDWAVEKLSELGVERLAPLRTERSEARARPDRWRRIARESAKQCRRATLLEVDEPRSLASLLDEPAPPAVRRIRLEPGAPSLGVATIPAAGCWLAIGPEGGFSAAERGELGAGGWIAAGLAATTLRSETAAIAAAAVAVAALAAPVRS